jgi:hypothetical protein
MLVARGILIDVREKHPSNALLSRLVTFEILTDVTE